MAGLATMLGFIQLTGSAVYSIVVGYLYDGTVRPMTTAIALAGALACVCFWRLRLARIS